MTYISVARRKAQAEAAETAAKSGTGTLLWFRSIAHGVRRADHGDYIHTVSYNGSNHDKRYTAERRSLRGGKPRLVKDFNTAGEAQLWLEQLARDEDGKRRSGA